MSARSKHALLALAATALGALAVAPAASPAPVHLNARPAATSGWLDRFNGWRINAGVPALTENSSWSAGDYDHALYMVKNDLVTHYETPGTPYYTPAGDTAARNSNIYISSTTTTTDVDAIDWWMQAPFHAMGMMDPRLSVTGFGSYRETKSGWQMGAAVDVLDGNSFSGGKYPVFFPGNGTTEPLTSYGGGEYPDPLQACSGYSAPAGLPVFIQVGGNVNTVAGPQHSFTGNGVALPHCIIDSATPPVGNGLISRGGVIVVPRNPLQSGVKYVVSLTVNGTPYSWSFTVGPLYVPPPVVTAVSPNTGPWTGGTAVMVTGTGFTNGVSSVMFGTTPAASFSVESSTSMLVVSPAHAAGVVDVTVTTPGGTSVTSAGDRYTFAQPSCDAAGLTSNKTSPQAAGVSVTFTATASGTNCTTPLYEFWTWDSNAGWTIRQPYGSNATLILNTTGMAPGSYTVDVWVEETGSAQGPNAYETFALESWIVGGCEFASLSPNPATSGGTATFTASAGGAGCDQPQYRFWLWSASTGYVMKQDYSAATTWSLDTTSLGAGNYTVVVHVKEKNSPLAYETWALSAVAKGTCGSPSVAAGLASPQPVGSVVHFTATAAGCTSPLFRYFYYPTDSKQFGMLHDWSSTPTFDWSTAGLRPGTYSIVVHVKQAASAAAYDTYAVLSFSLKGSAPTTLTASPASPQAGGTAVTLTAAAPGSPQYQVWLYPPGGPWTLVQDYSSNAGIHWTMTGLTQGTYAWVVYGRQAGSAAPYDSYAVAGFTIT
ncbi:MAG TPA: IPT/TIG domain-containing protein [Candidatus Dormibacteraeota bacterium]|nr:IPT/TIG domain-containing protein [Candidatus Dormibacteraeota bacterium]